MCPQWYVGSQGKLNLQTDNLPAGGGVGSGTDTRWKRSSQSRLASLLSFAHLFTVGREKCQRHLWSVNLLKS